MSYRMVVVGVVIILIPHIILGIVEIKFAVSGSSMGISVFNGSTLKFLMVDKSVSANDFGKRAFDELGTVIPIVVSLVQETPRDIPYEVTEWNVVDVFGKRSLYGLRGISVKIHPFVHLSTDVVHGFLVGNARQVIMAILHDHADALFLFPLLSACVIGTVLFVKIRGDSKLYRLLFG